MALKTFCPTCERNVYVENHQTLACPVCGSALLQTVDVPLAQDQMEGTK